jgi:hypothetical protein
MRLRSTGFLKVGLTGTALAVVLLGACKADDQPDARAISVFPDSPPLADAPPPVDAPPVVPDAPPAPTFGATASIQEVVVLDTSGATVVPSTTAPGSGGNITVSFTQNGLPNAAHLSSGTFPNTCSATRYNGTATPPPVINEGTVTFTVNGSTTVIPTCAFTNGAYRCIGAQGASGTAASVGGGVFTITDVAGAASTLSAADLGRYLVYADGSGKAFPIVAFNGPGVISVASGVAIDAAVPAFFTLAGAGPVPTSPEFLADTDTVDIAFVPGASSHFAAFTSSGIAVGDAWSFDDASKAVLATGLLAATADVQIGCDMAGGHCGTALGTVIAIDSTDTATTGAHDFPAATTNSASIQCTQIGDGKITIPLAQLSLLKDANPTRIRISVFRIGADLARATAGIQLAAGQGFVKFEEP